MGIGKWWKQMKETYGDLPPSEAFARGNSDGKMLTMRVKFDKMERKAQKKLDRKKARREKKSILFRN